MSAESQPVQEPEDSISMALWRLDMAVDWDCSISWGDRYGDKQPRVRRARVSPYGDYATIAMLNGVKR